MAESRRVTIVGRHPHTGEHGTVISLLPEGHLAGPMYRIALDDCQHGTEGCFADARNIRPKPQP